jgi:hypothetical protein
MNGRLATNHFPALRLDLWSRRQATGILYGDLPGRRVTHWATVSQRPLQIFLRQITVTGN